MTDNPAAQYELSEPPTDIISAVKYAPNNSQRLLVSSWDRYVYLYDTQASAESEQGVLLCRIEHRAPVLDVCFGGDDNMAYSAGLDWDVSQIDLETTRKTVLSRHKEGVKAIAYSIEHELLISASWDCTLHIHVMSDGRLQGTPATIVLPQKPYCMSVTANKLIVGMADRDISIYELTSLKAGAMEVLGATPDRPTVIEVEPWQRRESSLRFMTRTVCGMPDDDGYALSSIEGRVGVEWFDASEESQARKYAFKCHRQKDEDETAVVYPVNALAFHPVRRTVFASGGGDGEVVLWDSKHKRRVRWYKGFSDSVSSMAWSFDGRQLAVGVSPGFEDGNEEVSSDCIKVYVRQVPDADLRAKGNT